jgi:HSP20 family molecular chaperone IbpA
MNTTVDYPKTETGQSQRAERIGYICPCVNISSNKDDYLLEVEMPGVSKDGLEVTVEGNELTIIGRGVAKSQVAKRCIARRAWKITGACSKSPRTSTRRRSTRRWTRAF